MSIEAISTAEQSIAAEDKFVSLYEHVPEEIATRLALVQSNYGTAREMTAQTTRNQILDTVLFIMPNMSGQALNHRIEQSNAYLFGHKAIERVKEGVVKGVKVAYGLDDETVRSSRIETAATRMAQEKCDSIDDAANAVTDAKLATMRSEASKEVIAILRDRDTIDTTTIEASTLRQFDSRMDAALAELREVATGDNERQGAYQKAGWKLLEGMRRGGLKPRHLRAAEETSKVEAAMLKVEMALEPINYERGELIAYVGENKITSTEAVTDVIDKAVQSVFSDSTETRDFRPALRRALHNGIIAEMRSRRSGRILMEPSGIDFDGTRSNPHASKELVVHNPKPDKLLELSDYLTERRKMESHYAGLAEGVDSVGESDVTDKERVNLEAQLKQRAIRYVAERREESPGLTDDRLIREISEYLHPNNARYQLWEGGWLCHVAAELGLDVCMQRFTEAIMTT